jgi:hypothetical protein
MKPSQVCLHRTRDLFAFMVLAFSCEAASLASVEPHKPRTVPKESVWVGGLDGGAFVLVEECPKCGKSLYLAQIHGDSGWVWYKGMLRINKPDGTRFDVSSKDSYDGWDGTRLYLRDGRFLKKHKLPKTVNK